MVFRFVVCFRLKLEVEFFLLYDEAKLKQKDPQILIFCALDFIPEGHHFVIFCGLTNKILFRVDEVCFAQYLLLSEMSMFPALPLGTTAEAALFATARMFAQPYS